MVSTQNMLTRARDLEEGLRQIQHWDRQISDNIDGYRTNISNNEVDDASGSEDESSNDDTNPLFRYPLRPTENALREPFTQKIRSSSLEDTIALISNFEEATTGFIVGLNQVSKESNVFFVASAITAVASLSFLLLASSYLAKIVCMTGAYRLTKFFLNQAFQANQRVIKGMTEFTQMRIRDWSLAKSALKELQTSKDKDRSDISESYTPGQVIQAIDNLRDSKLRLFPVPNFFGSAIVLDPIR